MDPDFRPRHRLKRNSTITSKTAKPAKPPTTPPTTGTLTGDVLLVVAASVLVGSGDPAVIVGATGPPVIKTTPVVVVSVVDERVVKLDDNDDRLDEADTKNEVSDVLLPLNEFGKKEVASVVGVRIDGDVIVETRMLVLRCEDNDDVVDDGAFGRPRLLFPEPDEVVEGIPGDGIGDDNICCELILGICIDDGAGFGVELGFGTGAGIGADGIGAGAGIGTGPTTGI